MATQDHIPQSRVTIKYKTEVNGQKADRELPLRLMLMGDLSLGNSKDRQVDLDERQVRSLDGTNLDNTMKDMGIGLNLEVQNHIDPSNQATINTQLPIDSVKSFDPGVIAGRIPQLKTLMLMKTLLRELQATTDNNKRFRQMLNQLLADTNNLSELKGQLPDLGQYKLPETQTEE